MRSCTAIACVWPSTSAATYVTCLSALLDPVLVIQLLVLTLLCVCALLHDRFVQSKKGQAIKELVRREFEKGRSETDPEKIEALKAKYVALHSRLQASLP